MAKTEKREHSMALFETIVKLKSPEECCRFFEDLCTFWRKRAPVAPQSAGFGALCWMEAPAA